ncbi:hypothetical protein B296_00025870 [Ensete ventricosum]|uniref:Uncharacterized protein n=1 Tax=Ensete ventricosum TaxID=4639 RepID=A0A426XAK4_ENSVE|nr:hypothetical protein B296_00025870 [Ensete ventricosum]
MSVGVKTPYGLMIPRGSSTESSVGLSLGPSRGWQSYTQASLEVGGVTRRGPSDAYVSKDPEWPPRAGRVLGSGEKRLIFRERERESPPLPACCRSKCFIHVGGEPAQTPTLTLVVPRDMAEMYGGRAATVACDEGMGRHAALMGMGHAASCSDTSTSDSISDADLVP